ncbi:MAG: hypothetical protein IJK29_09560 [Bacteroidales bacterium]|nr:hypothetical protein [Bacteroidales bacterium]
MNKYLFPVLLALLAAVSCQREKQIDPNGAVEITVTATSDTRTYIENDGTAWIPYWNTGDVLGVMVDDNYGDPVSLTNTAEPGRTGTFSGTLREGVTDGEHTLTAWYPKDLRVGRSESVLKYVLAEEQALPSLTSFDPAMDLLVGLPETFVVADRKANVDNMRFRRVFTVVKVTLKDESTLLAGKKVSRVALTATGANLAGKAHVEITTGDITRWENPSATVAGNYAGDDFTINGTNSVFLLVNPATLAAGSVLTVDVTTDDDNLLITKSVNLPSEVVFPENKVTTLNFTLTDDNVTDTSGAIAYTWDFSTAEWQAALAEQAAAACLDDNGNTNVANWSVSYDGLTYTSGSKNGKWGKAGYIQPNGGGSVSERVFSFTAPADGLLKVTVSNTGDSEATSRLVTVNTGGSESSQVGGVPSKTPTTLTFEVKEGAVKVYPAGGGLRFYKLAFTTESEPPVEPDPQGELECPDPPQTGTVELDHLYGYATGVTGGDAATSANILHFDNGKALQTWLLNRTKAEKKGDHTPVTIWLSGTFGPEDGRDFSEAHPWFDVKDVSNLSFYGTDSFVMDRIGIFCVRANNIIIRNINFRQPKANNGADAVSMQECEGVWVDHCTFTSLNQTKDYEDGSTDITHGSKNMTVSWNHYILTQKSCLVGHSNSQTTDTEITATFHHNWFDQSSSRHPRVRFGKVHVYNNLFDGNTTYGVGSAYGAKVLVEYNYFDGVQLPTDICTYPAKESNESNLQGSVAGYLYATQDVLVNRPEKAKDPYPLTNVKYKSYGGETITPLTYADFKPAYDYIVTPAEDVPTVVKGGAGYGKLGWTEAPVAVNNGGITDFNGSDPDDPDQPGGGDDPGGNTGAHTYVLYMNDSASPVSTMDGKTGSTYFAYSTSAADFRTPGDEKYHGPFEIDGTTYQRGFKFDSKGSISFTTSSTLNTTVQFYFARRKVAESEAQIQLVPTGGTEQVWDTPYDNYGDSGVVTLERGTEYTLKQKAKEQAVILVIVTETE